MANIVDAEDFKKKATVVSEEPEAIEEYATLEESVEETPAKEEVAEEPKAPEETEDDLPEKYRGKSASDIARMHQELEKRLGQQSQEVGELRKHFDEYVQSSVKSQQSAPEVPEEAPDFFSDPDAAMRYAIENHPTLRQAREVAVEMAKSQAMAKLQTAHPDMKEVISDPGFQEWVQKSKIRMELFRNADQNYDFDAADELLSLYKERATVVKQTAVVEKQARKQEIKKASTGTARSNPEGQVSKKVYRRRDIIELMNSDPKRYEALMPEIMKAYQEGRVK